MSAPSTTERVSRVPRVRSDPATAVERLAEEMYARWRAGERPPAEEFFARLPDGGAGPDDALELLAEELALRQEHGQPIGEDLLAARFPRWPAQVRALVRCHQALGPPARPRFPDPGEVVGDFWLVSLLGRGAVGRVYLATQRSLADRQVVLKLAPPDGHEVLTLARLQHTHIVPLYSAHDFPTRGLYGLCMPHFGGTTLDRHAPAHPDELCRIGVCLADALQYAHDRGTLHLDVKPSNVLLAADGTPMLLDFHLARPPLRAGEAPPPWLGGTSGYMAPEHRAAFAAVEQGRPLPDDLDGRADVFGLGTTLVELLRRGERPTTGLADVIARSTAADPADRYPTAAAFADDLRRHLADLPLGGVRNRSLCEGWRKWRRRRPAALPVAVAIGLLLIGGVWWFTHTRGQADRAERLLTVGVGQAREGRYAEAMATLRGGESVLEGVPFQESLRTRLREERHLAERGQLADQLHAVCEQVRPLYAAEAVSRTQLAKVEPRCRELWADRELLTRPHTGPDTPEVEQRVRTDLIDLAVLLADLTARFAPAGELAGGFDRAMSVLDEAAALFGPTLVIDLERDRLRRVAGGTTPLPLRPAPRTAWEHVAAGRVALACGEPERAASEFERAMTRDPRCFWAGYYLGVCRLRGGDPTSAVSAFSACVALAPDSGWCHLNRGLAFAALGRSDQAKADFDRALALDDSLAAAYLARADLHRRAGRLRDAHADADTAARLGSPSAGGTPTHPCPSRRRGP